MKEKMKWGGVGWDKESEKHAENKERYKGKKEKWLREVKEREEVK